MENQEDILLEFGINIQSFQKDVKKIETVLKQFQASNSLFDLKVVTSQFKAFEKYILNLNKNMLVAMHKDMEKSDKSAQKTIYDSRIKQAKDANKKIVDNEKESRETELKNLKEAILSRNNEQINSLNYNNKQSEKYIKKQLSDEQKLRDQHSAFIKRLELKLAGELKPAQQNLLQDFIAKSKARVVNNKQDLHQLKLDYATALKAISTSTSATSKQVDAEFKKMARSWRGVFSDETGTTFMHKFFTTAQYATAGAGLYGIQGAFASIKDSIFEADKALTSFKAILDMNDTDAKELKDTVYKLGTTYGGNIQTYNESALALGRAGLSGKELSDSLKVVSQMALISGSSMDDVTEMLVTWSTVYKDSGDTVEQLGDKITAAANASLASIDGFKTMTSYVLSAGETAGMTSDALISFLASMKQIGKADSIVGTETRRLMNQLSSGSNDVREAYWKMGIDIKKVYEGVAQGGKEGEAVFREFMTNLSKVSDKTSQESIKNIKEVLDRQTIISTTAAAKQYEIQELAVKNATGSSERASKLMATTYEQATERIINKAKELSVIFGDNFTKSMFDEATVKDFELALNEATNVFKGFVSMIGSGLGSLASYLKYLDDIVAAYVAYKTVNLAIGKLGNLFSVDKIAEFSAKLIGMESSILKAKSAITGSGGLNAGLLDLATTGRAISLIFKSWPELITAAIVAMYSAYQEHLALEAKLKKQIQDYKDEQKKSEEEYSKFLNTNNGKLMSMYNTIEAYNKILKNGNISEAQKNIILKQRATLQKQYNDLLSNVTKKSNIDIGAKGEFKTDTKVKTASQIANYEKDISDEKAKQVELQEELDGKFKTTVEKAKMQYDIAKKELENAEKSKASDTYTLDVEKAKTKVKEAQLKLQQAEVNEKYKNKLLEIENKELQYTALASANDMLDAYRKLVTNKQLVALYQKENNSAEVIALSNNVKKTELQLEQAKALGDNVAIQEKESALTQAQIALDNKRKDIAKGITSNYLDATNAIKNMGEQLSKDIAKEQNLGDTFKDGSAEIEDWYATAKQNIEQMIEKYKDLYNQSSPEIEKLYDDLAKLKNIKLDDLTLKVRIEGIDNAISTLEATRNEYNGFYIDLEKAQLEYAKEYLSANGDIKKEKIAEAKFDKKNSDIKKDQLKSEIDAYSNLAGAIGGALEDGSKAQAAFMLTSQMLSMYNAVQAVIQAWASAPFPANLPAVATTTAAVIPLLSQVGQSLSTYKGGAVSSYDAYAAMPDNTGAGTVLGDSSKVSESITKSLSTLEDMARPEFKVMSQMRDSLKNIESTIGGVTTQILRAGGFQLGEGATLNPTYNDTSAMSNAIATAIAGSVAVNTGLIGGMNYMLGGVNGVALNPYTLAFSLVDSIFFGGKGTQAIGNALNELTGGLLNGVIGALDDLTGGLLGDVASSVFGGKTSQSLADYGITFGNQLLFDAMEGIAGNAYQTIKTHTSGGWFSSSKDSYNTVLQGLDKVTQTQFQLVIAGMYSTVSYASSMLGVTQDEINSKLENFQVELGKISFKDLSGEEIQEKLTNVFGKMGDELVKAAYATTEFIFPSAEEFYANLPTKTSSGSWFSWIIDIAQGSRNYDVAKAAAYDAWLESVETTLDGFQQVGEGLFETMTRVAAGMNEAEYYTRRLGASFDIIDYTDIINQQGDVALEALSQSIIDFEKTTYGAYTGVAEIVDLFSGDVADLYEGYKYLQDIRDKIEFIDAGDAQYLNSTMLYYADGIEGFNEAITTFVENFYTDEEKFELTKAKFTNALKELNQSVPTSAEEFKTLISGLDLSVVANQQLYASLLALSDLANEFYNSTENTGIINVEQSLANIKAFQDSFKTAAELAYDMAVELKTGLVGSLDELQDVFKQLSEDANGLTNAELELLNANKSLIQSSEANIKAFKDSLKTTDELTRQLADNIGVDLALSLSELSKLFNMLSNDADGLTNVELELLNANLALIEKTKEAENALIETTKENIKTFTNSLKTEQQLAYDKAIEQGVTLASTIEELSDIFNKLSTDVDGLTNADLDLLNTNLALIEKAKQEEITSIENIKTFTDSLKTEQQLAYDKAVNQGVSLVSTLEGLSDIFHKLSTDADGLTSADLDLLNANIALIEKTKEASLQTEIDALNKTLTDTTTSIDNLQSALSSIDDIISTLRGSLGGTTYQLSDFYAELENLISLNGTSDYKAFAEALSKVSGKVSVLTNTESFQSKYDMSFQQARVAAQMEELNFGTLDQLDYLKLIEENTRNQVSLLELQLSNISSDLKSTLLSTITNNKTIDATNNEITDSSDLKSTLLSTITNNKTTDAVNNEITDNSDLKSTLLNTIINNEIADAVNNEINDAISQLVIDTYQKFLNRNPDAAGLSYWTNELSGGISPVNTSNIGVSIGAAAAVNGEISRSSYVASLYTQGLGRTPTQEELNYWTNQSLTPTVELASLFAQIDPNFKYFAKGGIVTKPTLGLIGEAGYSEAVIPLKQNNDLFQSQEIVSKLDSIKMLMIKLVADNSKMLTIDRAIYASTVA